jgi:hypothetical protein
MSPRSSSDGINYDTTMNVHCTFCGLVAMCPKYDLVPVVAEHFLTKHPDLKRPTLGVHYRVFEAPVRCDSCGDVVELPFWTHISNPPTSVLPTIDYDGRWAVCDTCHDLWVERDLAGLIDHHWEITMAQAPGLVRTPDIEHQIKSVVAERYRLLFERWDGGTRETTHPA